MKRGQQKGYTLLEVMIFIAVSASLFFVAMIAIGGRQQDTQFTQAVRDLDSKLLDVMNDINTGFFDNAGDIQCSTASGRAVILPGANEQGTNDDCIFVGKALQFNPRSSGSEGSINVYNLVGQRVNGGNLVNSVAEAQPVIANPNNPNLPSAERIDLQWGIEVFRIVRKSNSSPVSAVAFLASFSRTIGAPSGDVEVSNAQSVGITAIAGTADVLSTSNTSQRLYSVVQNQQAGIFTPGTEDIVLCVRDAGGDRIASVTLKNQGNARTDTQLDFYDEVCG